LVFLKITAGWNTFQVVRIAGIGGGIVGASAALRLRLGGADVTLFHDDLPGGATAAGAGIIAAISSRSLDGETAAFRFAAARHYPALVDMCTSAGFPVPSYAAVGQLTVAFDAAQAGGLEAQLTTARQLVQQFGAAGVGVPQLLSGADVASRFPLVAPTAGALWFPAIARVDGHAMRNAIVQLAVRNGVQVVRDTARPALRNAAVVGVHTTSGLVDVDAAIIAAGCWSGRVASSLGDRVRPQRGQIVHLQLAGAAALPILDTAAGHYLLPFPGDRVVIGATRETGSGFDPALTAGGVLQVLGQGLSLVPALAGATWLEARVGLRPASTDGFPYLGAAPDVAGLWLATGMGASGLTLGPYAGDVVARQLLAQFGGEPGPAVPARFDPAR
jgi:D-amino-acid dehydrogenase